MSADCPLKMVYQQCGALCPQTCDNIGTSNCHGGCAEGCFCPDGQVLSNRRCIDPIACPGLCNSQKFIITQYPHNKYWVYSIIIITRPGANTTKYNHQRNNLLVGHVQTVHGQHSVFRKKRCTVIQF